MASELTKDTITRQRVLLSTARNYVEQLVALRQFRPYVVALASLIAVIWLPRGLALDRLVTPDEPTWLTNSGDFYQALAQGDFANTYQLEHPGVTTMWAGVAGFLWRFPAYAAEGPGQHDWSHGEVGSFLGAQGYEPLDVLTAGRVFMVLGITTVLGVAFLAAVRLLGLWPALVGFLLIAADPFHVAHSRLLHLDGMASSLVLLTLLAFLNFLYRGRRWLDLVLSAVAAGLAWLTKSPTLFLVPFVGMLLLFELESKWRSRQRLERKDLWGAFHALVLWGTVGLVVFVLLWPAMWVDPIFTLRRVLGATIGYAASGHTEAQLYFNGAIIDGDPGAHFYPITFLWRTTPSVLVGLGLAAVALAMPRAWLIPAAQRRPLAMLLLFAALFTIFMSLGAKKFDRYLLPAHLPLDLVAGAGWLAAVRWLGGRSRCLMRAAAPAIVLLALAGQAGNTISAFPYYLSYYNPLLGGTTAASKVMMVGWGEGLDQAAHYLSTRPGASSPPVMLGVWTGTFSYFYSGQILGNNFAPGEDAVHDWMNSDYCIIYINQWQRGRLPQELLDYLANLTPAWIVRLHGLDYVYVYDIRDVPPPDYTFLRPLEGAGEQGSRARPEPVEGGAEERFSSWRLSTMRGTP